MILAGSSSYQSKPFHIGTTPTPQTWLELQRAEPRLRLLADAVTRGSYGGDWEAVKASLRPLVGWYARRADLGDSSQWDTATRELSRLLSRHRRGGARG